jgi:hypothetical protein
MRKAEYVCFACTEGVDMVSSESGQPSPRGNNPAVVVLAWLLVSVPLLWGVWQTIKKAAVLFR